jgi:hypothetical protein
MNASPHASATPGGMHPARSPAHLAALVGVLFAVGVALGASGYLDVIARLAGDFQRAYVRAQYVMLQAQDNVSATGEIEYAVLAEATAELERLVARQPAWSLRASSIPGWHVVALPAGEAGGLALLRAQPFIRFAWRNRGLWICH